MKKLFVWKQPIALLFCALGLVYTTIETQAADGATLGIGPASGSVFAYRASVQWHWVDPWVDIGDISFTGYWEVSANYWQSDSDINSQNQEIIAATFAPVFIMRATQPVVETILPYIEFGVGGSLFSDIGLEGRRFSTNFQFEDRLGVGAYFGTDQCYNFNARFTHYSNASIRRPNNGINVGTFTLGFRF